jgi:NAD(P)-dependent dehydrogenase (short-subunit alcohol dehydrogenase family)
MHPSLADRAIMVTGASRGIGREIAFALLEAGARVAIIGQAESAHMAATLEAAKAVARSGHVLGLVGDVRRPDDCSRMAHDVVQAFGRIDVLFNNAGIPMPTTDARDRPARPFWEADTDTWLRMVETNVNGVFLMTRAVVPTMLAQRFGKIINLSTNRHTMVRRAGSPYGPSKAFVEAASRIWAQDLEGTGVTVNVLLPGGPINTRLDAPREPAPGSSTLPVSIIRGAALWLASDLSNGHSGQRFLARLWDEKRPLAERVAAAREDGAAVPQIM